MKLSVIILNYNVQYFLKLCIDSVVKAIEYLDAEIIVIDNNSNDGSCEMVKKDFTNIILIENKENSGFPKGNNIGVSHAKGEYICILNPDTVVGENTFIELLEHIKTLDNFGILGCKLIDGAGTFLPESKRGIPTPWVALTKFFKLYKLFPKNKFFNQYYAMHVPENECGKVEILVGAFMLMEKKLYEELEGFDENCFMYSDDIDLSYRALLAGKKNYYNGKVTCIHYKGESTSRDSLYMQRFSDAMNYFYSKHFKKSMLFDVFMKIGIFIFSYLKKNKKIKFRPKVDEYYLVSNKNTTKNFNSISIFEIIENTENISYNHILKDKKVNPEIIFDANYISYNSIIDFIYFNAYIFTFKIIPRNSSYCIGSNFSDDKGTIIL